MNNDDDELGLCMETQINLLAAHFYQMNGRMFKPDIDFRNSNHPEEIACWNMSIAAHAFINHDPELLTFQSS